MRLHGLHRDFITEPLFLWDVGWRRLLVGLPSECLYGKVDNRPAACATRQHRKAKTSTACRRKSESLKFPVNFVVVEIVLLSPCDWTLT